MERDRAIKLLEDFVLTDLKGKLSAGSFYQINGDRICTKCAKSKRRTLYMIISQNSPVMLKCFRATCLMEYIIENNDIDPNRARLITKEELLALGFDNEEAINKILDPSGMPNIRSSVVRDRSIIVSDEILSQEQKAYLAKRCKFTPTKNELLKYHIVPSINSVIEDNDIQVEHEYVYKNLNKQNAITFLCGGLTLSTRAIDKNVKIQKSILNITDVSSNGYHIGHNTTGKHTMVVTEGIFDIINAERYIANFGGEKSGVLYLATLGFTKTLGIVESYYIKNIDTMKNLILFMDSDVSITLDGITTYIYDEKMLYNLLQGLDFSLGAHAFETISVVYNSKGKDCGDLSENINMVRKDIDKLGLYRKYNKEMKKW